MASLALSALLAVGLDAPAAQAGTYTDIQTGGTTPATVTPPADANPAPPAPLGPLDAIAMASMSPMGGIGGPTYTIQVKPGTLTDTFTWTHGKNPDGTTQTDTTDPPPSCVLVEQTSGATWYVRNENGTGSGSGKADCGLPGATVTSGTYQGRGNGPSLALSAILYSVKTSPGASFSVSCSPTALFTGQTGAAGLVEGEAEVSGRASVYPITISVGPTTLVNGMPEALTGNPLTASLNPLPSHYSAFNYSWDIESAEGGSLCGDYISEQAEGTTVYTALTNPTVTFYDGIQDTATVNLASVTITFPDNTTGKATATATVMVVKPTLSPPVFNLVGGDNFSQHPNDTSSDYGAVETYRNLQITMPVGFTGGTGYVVQKVQSTSRVDMRHTGSNYYQQQEQFGSWMAIPAPCLDTDFPYPFASTWAAAPNGSTPTQDQTGSGGDTPAVFCAPPLISGDTGGPDWRTSNGNDQFMVWIMYNPDPSSSSDIWVPLNTFTWGWSNQASLNTTTNTWSAPNFQPASGSNNSVPSGDWPEWTTWVPYSGTGYLAMRP